MGIERTPDEYIAKIIAVFLEVRRVLRADGTLWLNLGSSYSGSCMTGGNNSFNASGGEDGFKQARQFKKQKPGSASLRDVPSCGSDDKALEDSRVAGRACPDCDGELTACSLNHYQGISRNGRSTGQSEPPHAPKVHDNGHSDSAATSPDASIPCADLTTTLSSQPNVGGASFRADSASAFPTAQQTSSRGEQPSDHTSACTPDIVQSDRPLASRTSDRAFVCMACGYSTKTLPKFKPKDMVSIPWMVAMALQADGWYLRQDIIWAKPNPMPESVTDRCTKSHEYLFLLSKSRRYFYDAEAIREPLSESMLREIKQGYRGTATKDFAFAGAQDASAVKSRILKNRQNWPAGWGKGDEPRDALTFSAEIGRAPRTPHNYKGSVPGRSDGPGQERRSNKDRGKRKHDGESTGSNGSKIRDHSGCSLTKPDLLRNKRSVWTVTTQPYPDAHFATYPAELIKPCILAGSRTGDTVLDPFAGSGTTGMVALELGRKAILIELNPAYIPLIEQRTNVTPGLALT